MEPPGQPFTPPTNNNIGGLLYKVKKVGPYWIAVGRQQFKHVKPWQHKDYEPLVEISADDGLTWGANKISMSGQYEIGSLIGIAS